MSTQREKRVACEEIGLPPGSIPHLSTPLSLSGRGRGAPEPVPSQREGKFGEPDIVASVLWTDAAEESGEGGFRVRHLHPQLDGTRWPNTRTAAYRTAQIPRLSVP